MKFVAGFAKEFASATLGGGNDHLVVGAQNEQVVFWDRRVGTGLEVFEDSHSEDVTRVRFQPGRRNRLFTGGVDGLACAFDVGMSRGHQRRGRLLTVMYTGRAIVELGSSAERRTMTCCGCSRVMRTRGFTMQATTLTQGNTLAYIPDTRRGAALEFRCGYPRGWVVAAGGLPRRVLQSKGTGRRIHGHGRGGDAGGAVGVYRWSHHDPASSPAVLGAPIAVMDGGHADIVRAMAWRPDNAQSRQ